MRYGFPITEKTRLVALAYFCINAYKAQKGKYMARTSF